MPTTKSKKVPEKYETFDSWLKAFDRRFKYLIRSGKMFTSDDIRTKIGMPPDCHPNTFGSVFRIWVNNNRDKLAVVGLTRSAIRSSRGRMLLAYQSKGKK